MCHASLSDAPNPVAADILGEAAQLALAVHNIRMQDGPPTNGGGRIVALFDCSFLGVCLNGCRLVQTSSGLIMWPPPSRRAGCGVFLHPHIRARISDLASARYQRKQVHHRADVAPTRGK